MPNLVTKLRRAGFFAAALGMGAFPGVPGLTQSAGPASILNLQPFAEVTAVPIGPTDAPIGTATLHNLNPRINTWYVLSLEWRDAKLNSVLHLENPAPLTQTIALDRETRNGLLLRQELDEIACGLWSSQPAPTIEQARRSGLSYAPLCEGRLYLRNKSVGYRTTRELVTDVLRDRVWGGEKIITFVKDWFVKDSYLTRAEGQQALLDEDDTRPGPLAGLVAAEQAGLRPVPGGLGIAAEFTTPGKLAFGRWYPVRGIADIFVSIIQAGAVAPEILQTYRDRVRALDSTEAEALVYLIAFDLADYELGFEIGTDHPRVGWSERSLPEVRTGNPYGPDGLDSTEPLVRTGVLSPAAIARTIATFTGGFKRTHGAFRYGELARRNSGNHYGWLQHGVVFSSLQPELATLLVLDSGSVDLRTWQASDQRLLPSIRHARQNGVPIITRDTLSGEAVPGGYVGNWGAGNWSGSASGQQRTVRGGVCLQNSEAGRYLVYAYFSSVTPSAMARVFQAYRCEYAMLLDMNALEHTYLAVYRVDETGLDVQHLVRGMEEVDRTARGHSVPRFIGYSDTRDFFYVLRRGG